jgi:DNA polymerase-3 subunit gamma/tau
VALALYRKYRPATFAEVVGQDHITEPLRTALGAGRINHAYLFSGPRGCGKTSSARILARSLNCEKGPTPDPCGVCPSCIALAPEGPGSLDVVELDAASHGGVDDTRDLRDKAFYMPAESRFRVFIIDEAHMVSTQGFNALLKIVEEPPEHLVFIFATTEPEKVLPTIRSRTHHYPFRLLPPAVLRSLLERLAAEEGVAVEPAVFPLVVKAGGGSARDALSVLDQLFAGAGEDGISYASAVALLGVTDSALLDEMVDALAASDGASVFGVLDKVAEAGHDPRRFGTDLLQRLRDLVILQAVPDAAAKGLIDAPEDELAAMTGQSDRLGAATLTRYAEVLHAGLTDMRGTTSPRLVLELLCARMLLPAASISDGALLQRLERLERRLSIAGKEGSGVGGPSNADSGTAEASGANSGVPTRTADTANPGAAAPSQSSASAAAAEKSVAAKTSRTPPAAARPSRGLDLPTAPVLSSTASGARSSTVASGGQGASEAPEGSRPGDEVSTAAPAKSADTALTGIGTVDVTDVRRLWPEILEAVKRQRRTTQVLLESATVAELSGRTLALTMPSPALARKVEEAGNADVLKAALREILGVDWMIRCRSVDAGGEGVNGYSAGATGPGREAPERSESSGRFAAGGGDLGLPDEPGAGGRAAAGARSPRDRGDDRTSTSSAGVTRGRRGAAEAQGSGAGDLDDIPDEYLDPDAVGVEVPVIDPEQAAIDLLTAQLGARPIDPDS